MAKRALNLLLAGAGLLLLSPLMLVIALVVKLDSPGPVFFRQERVGRGGFLFRIHKFRTMRHAAAGPQISVGDDARVTRSGRFLRRSKLDELPQLIDVLAGTMSLVGPRPEVPRYVAMYPPATRAKVLSVRPGMTDLASLEFRDEGEQLARAADPELAYVNDVMPRKLQLAEAYVDQASLRTDLRLILRTLTVLLGRQGDAVSSSWAALDAFLTLIRPRRRLFALAIDALVIVVCWNATYLFRLGFERWIDARPAYDGTVLLGLVALYLAIFAALGVPRGMWRFTGFGDIKRLSLACALGGAAGAAGVQLLGLNGVPRAVLALHPVVTLMGLTLVRVAYRMLYEHMRSRITGSAVEGRRALVLGAGGAARRLIAGVHHDGWVIVGLLDDDPSKQGARIGSVPVLGPLDGVALQAATHGITHLIVAMPTATRAQRRRAVDLVLPTRLPVLTVPNAQELQEGSRQRLRDMQPEDLLGREPVVLDEAGIADCLAGRTVLITGAGGSIGSELCRQIARYRPARLVLYELNEFNLYTIEQELGEAAPGLELVRLIGDVKDLEHLRATCTRWRPQVVFHAAAYKHVPLMERDNAWAALRNNTLGTWQAARAAAEAGAQRFVLISTDKAVNPSNVMGATKRAAEMAISLLAQQHPGTRFMAVRFGNVLGSSGSVIPKFKEQIARGGPVTVTHPEIIRYFMTIPEAVRLVLQAAAIGASGQVLVLDMGEPVRIVDLAREMIRLAGHAPDEIEIVYTGLRPGEKLYEELLADADSTLPTPAPGIHLARLSGGYENVRELIDWAAGERPIDDARVQDRLAATVPEYRVGAGAEMTQSPAA